MYSKSGQYWMIYRGPGFLELSPPPPPVSSTGDTQEDWERNTCWRERERGAGAKSYDDQKAWSSINHSILSAKRAHNRIKYSNSEHKFWASVEYNLQDQSGLISELMPRTALRFIDQPDKQYPHWACAEKCAGLPRLNLARNNQLGQTRLDR